ncbi:hypothetical protein EV294_102610 [Paenibacillus sp. BK033]|uniref:hypothetical protein n=1 Tax=Paenibacillus sp. BK033 TaxID=2512133 RepID=UPI00104C77B0|nr:hypothetical protein [Paenibacillus sp. BK033]TCM99314.1 hypothetical protein EV294_102610 [Paenibacillus sp. BK033]
MISLMLIALLFLTGGTIIVRRLHSSRNEMWVFIVISCIGIIIWSSIILYKPLDLNKAIGWMIDSIAG